MDRIELIEKYTKFFEEKGHKLIPNYSLVPENDPTVLFTTAGMHPLVPFLIGQKHPLGKKLVGVQRCIRTGDIDEVGDTIHHTFFEMLGNWSLGEYFKNEAIKYSFEFLTKVLKIPKEKLAVSVFEGDKDAPIDTESIETWKKLGIPEERIVKLPKKNNWWGPAGLTGPCGPDTEMFYWKSSSKVPKVFDPENENWVEIWNDVLMQYNKDKEGNYIEAKQKNIDTGMGVERTVTVLNRLEDNYEAEMWKPIIERIEKLSQKTYKGNEKAMRIIADHVKAAVFIISDGVIPGNSEQGYVLRRLIRRAVKYGRVNLKLHERGFFIDLLSEPVFEIYKKDYPELLKNQEKIKKVLLDEENKFNITLINGMKLINRINGKNFSGKEAFLLYQSYGFPIEMTFEILKEKKVKINFEKVKKDFREESEKHQKLSQTASAGKFKSGLVDNSVETTKLHTATHLLNEALRQVLKNPDIKQKGSNITPERLRFDFNFPRKLTSEEIKKVEEWVNDKIKKNLVVKREEMSLKEALDSGAQAEFGTKYPERVSVYTVLENEKNPKSFVSKEFCTGPHVKKTGEIGIFKIVKEESSAAGIRRIKAVLK